MGGCPEQPADGLAGNRFGGKATHRAATADERLNLLSRRHTPGQRQAVCGSSTQNADRCRRTDRQTMLAFNTQFSLVGNQFRAAVF